MKKKAVYAGSFDPVTMGHLWIIEQAASMFDKVTVAIGGNVDKNYTFSVEERIELLKNVTRKFDNIEISEFNNEFLIHYAQRIKAQYIIRGIRNASDYEYEKRMRYVNSDICDEINTIFLIPPRNVSEISSSLVKGLIGSKNWESVVKKYVPEPAIQAMLRWEQKNAR